MLAFSNIRLLTETRVTVGNGIHLVGNRRKINTALNAFVKICFTALGNANLICRLASPSRPGFRPPVRIKKHCPEKNICRRRAERLQIRLSVQAKHLPLGKGAFGGFCYPCPIHKVSTPVQQLPQPVILLRGGNITQYEQLHSCCRAGDRESLILKY